MMIVARIRRGEGPFWGTLKRFLWNCLHFHVPVFGLVRPLFALLYHLHVCTAETLRWLVRVFWYEPLFRSQCDEVGERFQMEQLPYITGSGRIALGKRVRLSGKPSFTFNNRHCIRPEIRIGDGTFIGHECNFGIAQRIAIGKHCLLAARVSVRDFDGHPLDAGRRRANEPTPPEGIRPICIGNDVWIGAGAIILKGVRIGDRAVIGAGAVVTRDVAADTVVAGNPARVVKHLESAPSC